MVRTNSLGGTAITIGTEQGKAGEFNPEIVNNQINDAATRLRIQRQSTSQQNTQLPDIFPSQTNTQSGDTQNFLK